MSSEFFDLGYVKDPGPKPFIKAQGLRKVYVQQAVGSENLNIDGRRHLMSELAVRAVDFLYAQGWEVQWHTLEFKVRRTGMEFDHTTELWRWEAWVS
jgi:hypothetical protein